MNRQDNDKWLDDALTEVIGSQKPRTDFEKWKNDHPDAVKMLMSRAGRQISATAGPLSIRSMIMRSPIAKLSAAAAVIIACVIGLSLWRGTESGIALADVLAQIEKVEAYRYQWSFWTTGERDGKAIVPEAKHCAELVSPEYGFKIERLNPEEDPCDWTGTLWYLSIQDKAVVEIWPKDKKYSRTELDDAQVELAASQNEEGYDWLCSTVERILRCKYENMGRSTIDGIEVEGFRTTDPNFEVWKETKQKASQVDARVWVDVKTLLPVRTEAHVTFDKQLVTHLIQHGFQWDVSVDACEFVPVMPDDYTLLAVFKWPACTEETAIQGLKQLIDLLGNYPNSITNRWALSAFEKSETPAAKRLQEELRGLPEPDKHIKKRHALMCVMRLYDFVDELTGKDLAYHGKTVVPRDAHSILMQWRVSGSEYRVIYGDLHAETVTPDRLAELEAALPNEETAIQALNLLVDLLGQYPDPNMNIRDFTVLRSAIEKSETPAALQLKEELRGLTEEEINSKLEDFLMPIRGLAGFCQALERDKKKDLEYVGWKYGRSLTLKDADKVLLRWKVSDNEYRVIYGDLRAETVSPDKLAELEAALPK